jgi:guanine deaminase
MKYSDNAAQVRLMRRAIDLAVDNVRAVRGGPFGAVVAQNGNVIAEGVNQVTTLNDPTAHAEVTAIRKACQRLGHFELSDCELYTSCEPCPMCLGAVYWARLGRLYFAANRHDAAEIGFDDSRIYDELSRDLSRRMIPAASILREESLEAFRLWRESAQKIPY